MLKSPVDALVSAGAGADPAPCDPAGPRPLRIGFLSYRSDPRVGGQGVYLSQAADSLARLGHKVDVLSGPPYPELSERVRLVRIPSMDLYAQPHHGHRALRWRHLLSWTDTLEYFGHLSGRFMEPETFGRRAFRYLRDHRSEYDVVIDNQSLSYGLLKIDALGLPVVGIVHHPIRRDLDLALTAEPKWGMRALIRQWYGFLRMQEKVAPRLRDVVVVSEASRQDVAECLGVSLSAMKVIPPGIDQTVFRPREHLPRRTNRLLTTASADVPLKGLRYLIEAYARLRVRRPDLELVVIGKLREGPTEKLIAELNLGGCVRFISDLTNEQMAEQYAQATICVSPSLYEGFGLPAAEAMSCGAPVVVTDGGALPEVVGDAGVVVRRGCADSLAAALGQLLDDPAELAAMGRASLARARTTFDWGASARAYDRVLRNAVQRSC